MSDLPEVKPGQLAAIVRPNGKTYRPRKVVGNCWENNDRTDSIGVIVFGTHDIDRATPFATELVGYYFDRDLVATQPRLGWWRDGFRDGERAWVDDPVRGRAGVMFVADEDDHAVPSREEQR